MEPTKPIWASKTFWGAMVTVVAAALLIFGVTIKAEEQETISGAAVQLAAAVLEGIGVITIIVGRVKAKTRIG